MSSLNPVRISELPQVSSLEDADLLLTVDSSDLYQGVLGRTKNTSLGSLKNYIFSSFKPEVISPTHDQLLKFDSPSSRWKNWTPNYLVEEDLVDSIPLSQLMDVSISDPLNDKDTLLWSENESSWKSTSIIAALELGRVAASIKDLASLERTGAVIIKQYYVNYLEPELAILSPIQKRGGGVFYWDSAIPRSSHDGGIFISPTVPYDGTRAGLVNFLNKVGETEPSATGCWVRLFQGNIHADFYGCVGNMIADDQPSIQKALTRCADFGNLAVTGAGNFPKTNVVQISGGCRVKRYIEVPGRVILRGDKNNLFYPMQDSGYASAYNYLGGPIIYADANCIPFNPSNRPWNCIVALNGDNCGIEGIVVDGYELPFGSWFPFIRFSNPNGPGGSYIFNGELFVIDPEDPRQVGPLTFETTLIPSHQFGDAWYPGYQLKAFGGNATGVGPATSTYTDINPGNPYQFDVISGTIPAGFAVSKSGWVTCVNPPAPALNFIRVRVTDADGNQVEKDLVLEITGKYIETPNVDFPPATINQAYKYKFNVLNDDGVPHYWWLVNGPEGLVMDRDTGEITGTPPANSFGKYRIKIAITDTTSTANFEANTLIDEISLDFTVENSSYADFYIKVDRANIGVPYTGVVYPVGGIGPFTWEIDLERSPENAGGYPLVDSPAPGLTLSSDGIRAYVTGTPTTAGNYNFYIRYTDAEGKSAGILVTFGVESWTEQPQLKMSQTWNMPTAVKGQPYSYQVEATLPGMTFSAKALPTGLTCSTTGLISGTPTGGKYINGIAASYGDKLSDFTIRHFNDGAGLLVDGPSNVHTFSMFYINACDVGIKTDNFYDSRMDRFYIYNTRIGLQLRGGSAANTFINGRIEYIHEHGVTALFSPDCVWNSVYWDTCGYTGLSADRCNNWTFTNCLMFRSARRIPPRGKYYMPDSRPEISTHMNLENCNSWQITSNTFIRGTYSGSSSTYLRTYEPNRRRITIAPFTCLSTINCKEMSVIGNGMAGCTRASYYSRQNEFEFNSNDMVFEGNVVQFRNQFSTLKQDRQETKNLLNNADKSNFVSEGTEDNVDTYFPNVSILLHGHEFTDRSTRAYAINNTDVTVNNSIFKFGTGSLEFNGTSAFITPSVADNASNTAGFYFGTSPFTIELSVYPLRNNVVQTLMDFGATSSNTEFALILDANGKLALAKNRSTGGQTIDFTSTTTIPNNVWTKIVMTRTSGIVRIYINDVLEATLLTEFNGRFIVSGFNRPMLGRGGYTGATDFFQGYMQEIRVTKDVSRYSVLETLTPQTRPFGDVNFGTLPPDTFIFSPAATEKEHYWANRANSVKLGPSSSITKPLKVIRSSRNDLVAELRAGNGSYISGEKNPSYYYYNFTKEAETGVTAYTFQTCEFRTWVARVNRPKELDELRGKTLLLTMWARSNNRNAVSIFTQFYAGTSGNGFKVDGGFYTKFTLTPFWRKYTFQIKAPDYDLTLIDPLSANAILKFYFDDKSQNYDVDFGGMMLYEDDGKFGFTNYLE